jgi:hypothetical protein
LAKALKRYFRVAPTSRITGATTPLPQTPPWREQGQLYFFTVKRQIEKKSRTKRIKEKRCFRGYKVNIDDK